MKKETKIICVVLLLPLLLFVILVLKFRNLPMSSNPPSWGDAVAFIGVLFAAISVYLLYEQLNKQSEQDELNRISGILNDIPSIIETIHYDKLQGADAIVSFGQMYDPSKTPHPRIVVDKVQYVISQIKLVLIDLAKVENKNETTRIAQKACLLFFTHLYFPVSAFVNKLEPEYEPFKNQFLELQRITYSLLRNWELVGRHKESESFLISLNNKDSDMIKLFKRFK